jgi:hypothetical protein
MASLASPGVDPFRLQRRPRDPARPRQDRYRPSPINASPTMIRSFVVFPDPSGPRKPVT